jgi:hypothetical protein
MYVLCPLSFIGRADLPLLRFCLRRITLRACSIPSTPFTISHRSITSLTTPLHPFNQPRAAVWPLQRRFAHDEVAQAEPEADGAEEARHGVESISETPHTEVQKHGWEDLGDSTTLSSAAKSLTDGFTESTLGADAAAGSANESFEDTAGFSDSGQQDSVVGYYPPSRGIYVGNLYFDITEARLEAEFKKAGEIEKVNIVRDGRGFSKGLVPSVIPVERIVFLRR